MLNSDLPSVSKWMTMTQSQVLDKFMTLKGAFHDGSVNKQTRFVFVPGKRDDRALLVAHADTVWGEHEIRLGYHDNILFSKNRLESTKFKNSTKFGIGIGADDRAGCAILWELRELGHSLLITSGEEQGCIATKRIMRSEYWDKELNDTHSFAMQFDRRGKNDIVFYENGTKRFEKYIREATGFKTQRGSFTDIRHICLRFCGVNMSVGYYNEHTSEEKLCVDQWYNSLQIAKTLLSGKLQRYDLDKDDLFTIPFITEFNHNAGWHGHFDNNNSHYPDDYAYSESFGSTGTSLYKKKEEEKNVFADLTAQKESPVNTIQCRSCKHVMNLEEWYENIFKCTQCKQEN